MTDATTYRSTCLAQSIAALVHDEAVQHFGLNTRDECHVRVFAQEAGERISGDRSTFVRFLAVTLGYPRADLEDRLREYDEAARPLACVHWVEK